MPKLPNSFKPKDHDDMKDFSLLPKDKYLCAIKKSEMKPTQSNKDGDTDNEMLAMEAHILEGKFKDRILFINLNLINESEQAVEISNEELGTLCRACGIDEEIDDSDELHGIPFIADVYIKKGKKDRSDSNEISMYLKPDGKKSKTGSKGEKKKGKKESPFKKGNKNKTPEVTKEVILEWADENDIESNNKKAKAILKEYEFKTLKHIDEDSDDLEEIFAALKEAFEDDDDEDEPKKKSKKKEEPADDDDDEIDLSEFGQKELVKLAVALELGKKLKLKKWSTEDLIDKIEDCEEEDITDAIEELELS